MDREKKKLDGKSFNIIEDNIKKLQELFPEIVTEGKVDIDKLALLFDKARNEDTEENLDGEERYEFTWKGKKESMRIAQKQSTGTLRPCREDSVNFDETQNLYIEGDNLEVLRALQNSYRGKVKMIYIDPPYNTGNDFVYKDDFKDNIANYKEKMNEAYKTNTNNDGRYHTNWLNMMYPRLKLARNLLTEDGVIFISIDDNEVDNLRKICDEIYGENNFVGETVRVSSPIQNISKFISIMHDYTLVYCKNKNENNGDWKVPKNNVNEFQNRARKLMKNNLNHEDIAKELRALVKYPRFYDFDHYYFCDEKGVFRAGPIGGVQSGNITTKILHPKTGK
ncbi:site-specific DNA-methyltransferase [Clostridium perfringens]